MKLARRLQMFSSFFMMSHTKIAASRNEAHRFKSAATTALVLSAMAGGVMLSSGQAQASTTTCTPLPMALTPIINPGGQTCTTSDPNLPLAGQPYSNNAKALDVAALPAGTLITLEGTGLNWPLAQQQIDTDFNPPYTGGLISSIYGVTATPGFPFDGIDLSASGIGGFTVKKEVYTNYVGGVLSNKIAELNLTGAGFVPVVPLNTYPTQIYIRDTFNNPIPGASSIDNVENTLRNVPGPLPILGAGAAFGFSRKLRGRIKAARLG